MKPASLFEMQQTTNHIDVKKGNGTGEGWRGVERKGRKEMED